MNTKLSLLCLTALLAMSTSACESREERVSEAVRDGQRARLSETNEAQREISKAQQNVNETKIDKAREIADAQAALDKARASGDIDAIASAQMKLEAKKSEAGRDVADAQIKVEDEKVEATKELADAERKADENVREAAE